MRSRKKQIFLILTPSLFLFVLYGLLFARPNYATFLRLQKNRLQLNSDVSLLPSKLTQETTELERLKKKIEERQAESETAQQQIEQLCKRFPKSNPVETLKQVNTITKENKTILIESGFFAQNQNQRAIFQPEVLKYYQESTEQPGTSFFRIAQQNYVNFELIGRFSDVYQVFADLSKLNLRIFPLSITMKKFKKNFHRWEIILWIE